MRYQICISSIVAFFIFVACRTTPPQEAKVLADGTGNPHGGLSPEPNPVPGQDDLAHAEAHMASLTQGQTPRFRCFSFEERFAVHQIEAFETDDPNFRYIIKYSRRGEPPFHYRTAVSDIPAGLVSDTQIRLRLAGNYGSLEVWYEDGQLYADKDHLRMAYVPTQDFNIRQSNIVVNKDEFECRL